MPIWAKLKQTVGAKNYYCRLTKNLIYDLPTKLLIRRMGRLPVECPPHFKVDSRLFGPTFADTKAQTQLTHTRKLTHILPLCVMPLSEVWVWSNRFACQIFRPTAPSDHRSRSDWMLVHIPNPLGRRITSTLAGPKANGPN